jgi:DnaK suppressor protein
MDQQQLVEFKHLFRDIRKNYSMTDFNFSENIEEVTKGDEVDRIIEDRDKSLLIKLKGRQDFFLKKISQAEHRIESGCFGECLECGDDISLDRLKARPTATQCIECKEVQERKEQHIQYEKKSHTHGKTFNNKNVLSLKDSEQKATISNSKILKFNKDRINLNQH